jgi:hypothetical protein
MNKALSDNMKEVWKKQRQQIMAKRKAKYPESKAIQSANIKKHFEEHPEHATAISVAQKIKWVKYKKALAYCVKNNISLCGDDCL